MCFCLKCAFGVELTVSSAACAQWVYLEQDPHGAAGVSRVELQQLLLRTLGAG